MSHVGQTSRINLGGKDNYNGEGQGSKDALLLKHLEINSSLRLQQCKPMFPDSLGLRPIKVRTWLKVME